jgi:hypothetical protein
MTGQLVPVRAFAGPGALAGFSYWDADGTPTTIYGPAYFAEPPLFQVFSSAHECGHLVLQTSDEFQANCFAIRNLPLTQSELATVGQIISNMGPLPPTYGGSGVVFWQGTMRACPDLFQIPRSP